MMEKTAKITILLADDQKLFVDNLKIVLESRTKDMRVCGIAYNGREAVHLVETLRPSLILMDVRMPVMDGVQATKLIHAKYPHIRIVMLTTFDDDEYVHQALHYGAVGYILKNIAPAELISSIRAVKDGAVLISPSVAQKLMQREDQVDNPYSAPARRKEGTELLASLTPRELEIVKLASLAYDNKQIAESLQLAEQTVKNSMSMIYMKMGVSRRTQLMKLFEELKRAGLIT